MIFVNDIKKLISSFTADILDYMISHERQNIHIKTKIDEDGVYFLFHNDEMLDECEDFQRYVFEKEREHFLANNVRNVCFTYDFRLVETVGVAWGIQDLMESLTFDISSKTDYPRSNLATEKKREVLKLVRSPKTSFLMEYDIEFKGVAL